MARNRTNKRAKPARMEFTYDAAAPLWSELTEEARLREVTLQQHIEDLLQSRHNIRHGRPPTAELLWVPNAPQAGEEKRVEAPVSEHAGASAVADKWM